MPGVPVGPFVDGRDSAKKASYVKVAPYSFLTARELVSKSRYGASFKKSTRKSRATSTTASNSHWSNFSNHRCSFPMC